MKVQKAQQAVYQAEQDIKKNEQDILDTKTGMRSADPRMYESYDNFLKHLWAKAEQLEYRRQELQEILDEEVRKLVKCEQAVKVLEKHKEKSKEIYLAEEKAAELKQFSELGVTRFYKANLERIEEEEQQILKELSKLEGIQ